MIDLLSRRLDISRDTVSSLIDSLSKTIGDCCSELDSVIIPSFGTFEPKKRLERVALHPASGKRLLVPPKVVLTFKPSPILKSHLKQKPEDGK